jgi:hypothetical protein
MKLLLMSVIAVSLVGCSTGPELLTEQVYPAIEDHEDVIFLTEMPVGAEQITVLRASSGWGSNYGQFPENAELVLKRRIAVVEDLQRRAAKVGANAVVLTRLDPIDRDGAQLVGGQNTMGGWNAILFRTQLKIVEGIAIYVK